MSIKEIPYRYRSTAKTALLASAALGPVGAFSAGGDILAIAAIWGTCLISIASQEGCNLDKDTAIGICKSAFLGVSGYYVGCNVATKLFYFIPGAGIFAAIGASSLANVMFTYRFVLTLCNIFEKSGKNRLNFDKLADEIQAMFKGNGLISDTKDIISICL